MHAEITVTAGFWKLPSFPFARVLLSCRPHRIMTTGTHALHSLASPPVPPNLRPSLLLNPHLLSAAFHPSCALCMLHPAWNLQYG